MTTKIYVSHPETGATLEQENWAKISEILSEILDQPEHLRAEKLELLCADEVELKREVESLLAFENSNKSSLKSNQFNVLEVFKLEEKRFETKVFGHYRIVSEIGRGGMGAVFLAERDDGEFRQQVALKIIRQAIVDSELERRFKRERQILASLNHPNIATLLDGGVSAEGEPYLVMEYVKGAPLLEFAGKHQLSIEARLDLFLKICAAVTYAHNHQVIHRDIKPANILVTDDGEPKLLDFGLAKFVAGDLFESDALQTETQFRAFTMAYASPEQIRGAQLTATTDIYSLSVVLYELLTGLRPYNFENKSFEEILISVHNTEPQKPSEIWLSSKHIDSELKQISATSNRAQNASQLRGDLDNICLMGLRNEPKRRYQTVTQISKDIKSHLKGLPVSARPNTVGYLASKYLKRNQAIAIAFVISLVAVTFFVFSFIKITPTNNVIDKPKTIAVLPLKSLSNPPSDQELRVGMADSIVTKLGSVKQIAVRPTSATARYLDQNYDLQTVGNELKVDSILEGSLQKVGNNLQINLQMVSVNDGKILWAESFTNDLANVLNGQESIANRVSRIMAISTNQPATEQSSSNLLAQDAFLKGNYALNNSTRKIENIFAARDFFEQAIRLDSKFAMAYSNLALTYTLAGSLNHLSPRESYPQAEQAAKRALEIDPNLAAAYLALGEIEVDFNWNWEAAETNFKKALELSPNLAKAHHGYSEFLARMRRFDESHYHSDIAQELDPTRINYGAVRGLHYFYERKFDQSIAQCRKTLEKDENVYLAWLYLGVSADMLGNYDEALKVGKKAQSLTGGAPPDIHGLGITYSMSGDTDNMKKSISQLEQFGQIRYVDKMLFVNIYTFQDKDKAIEYLKKAHLEKSYWLTTLKVNPLYDGLRSDPRFQEYLVKMKLD